MVSGIAICRREGIAQWHSLADRLVNDESEVYEEHQNSMIERIAS